MTQQTLYYYAPSASAVLTDNTLYNVNLIPAQYRAESTLLPYKEYEGIDNLIISSSGQIVGKSGSISVFALPIATTNIIYGQYPLFDPIPYTDTLTGSINLTQSVQPLTSSFQLNINYSNPSYKYTTASYIIITGSNTSPSYSILNYSASAEAVSTGLIAVADQSYSVYVYGDPVNRYDINLSIFDTDTSTFLAAQAVTDATASASFFIESNEDSPFLGAKNINAYVNVVPAISMKWLSKPDIPISPSDDLVAWNNYLGITASLVVTGSTSVVLYGNNLQTAVSLSLSNELLTTSSFIGLRDMQYLDWSTNNLSSLQALTPYTALKHINVSNNIVSSSFPNISTFLNLEFFDCSNNRITGSIPDTSLNRSLKVLNCSYNNLTGSIPSLKNNSSLQEIRCDNNKLSGSLPSLQVNTALKILSCSYNNITGLIPSTLPYLSNLEYISLENNNLSGQIPPIGASLNLKYFNVSNNQLSGSIPGQQSGSLLEYLNVSSNALSTYISGGVPTSLTYLNAFQNNLSQSAIDGIVKDIYEVGNLNGYLNLSGSGNSTASFAIFQTASILEINRGWEVYLNGTTFDADFLVVTYQFDGVTGGTDLDIRQRIVSPVGTKYHGYACTDIFPSFNAALTVPPNIAQTSYTSSAPYLYWSGDNTGTGVESTYVDLSSFGPSDTIQVECRAFWFGTITQGSMSLDIEAYKGGYMSQSGYQFQNVGGTQVANLTLPYIVTSQGGGASAFGQKIGDLYYNKVTKTLAFV